MNSNLSLDISTIDYKITPIFKTIGRKKQEVFDKIEYEVFIKHDKDKTTTAKGTLAKKDIVETIPMLESYGVDLYTHIANTILTRIIINTNEKFGTKLDSSDFEEFAKENLNVFDEFINNFKMIVDDWRSKL